MELLKSQFNKKLAEQREKAQEAYNQLLNDKEQLQNKIYKLKKNANRSASKVDLNQIEIFQKENKIL